MPTRPAPDSSEVFRVRELSDREFTVSERQATSIPNRLHAEVVACPACGKKNRVSSSTLRAKCGACGALIRTLGLHSELANSRIAPNSLSTPRFVLPIEAATSQMPPVAPGRWRVSIARVLMQGGLLIGIGAILSGNFLAGVGFVLVGAVGAYVFSGGHDLN